MSNDSPIASQSRRPRGLARVAIALALGVALGVAGTSLYVRHQARASVAAAASDPLPSSAQEEAMRQQRTQLRFTQGQLDAADGELMIERAARQELETQLRAAQAEVGRVRDQLAFYEQLLPPAGRLGRYTRRAGRARRAGPAQGAADAQRPQWRRAVSGALRFQAVGTLKGETVTVELAPMQVKSETTPAPDGVAAGLALQFDQYQRSQGMLALPEGFVPESVTITVLEGDTVRATRSVKLEL